MVELIKRKKNTMHTKPHIEKRIKQIKRKTRSRYNTEENIRIVLEGIKRESLVFKWKILK